MERLRALFLGDKRELQKDYWDSEATLEEYDRTLGERIRWKWDNVLAELKAVGWQPPGDTVVDWGCGTGVASRAFADVFPIKRLHLHDRSARAVDFARKKITSVETLSSLPDSGFVLLLSHILSELSDDNLRSVQNIALKADAVLWVEPGTPESSRRLIEFREMAREKFQFVAPCPHQATCGLRGNEKDWCHFFGEVPSWAHQSAEWREIATRLGIDLRSLPLSYLCLSKSAVELPSRGRLLGRPRAYKGYVTSLVCRESGVKEEKFLKRDESVDFSALKKGGFRITISDSKR